MDNRKLHSSPAAYRRQCQVEDCLIEDMLRKPYRSIAVTDLAKQAGFSRKSFYNYYRDKDSCLYAYITRLLRECVLRIAAIPDNTPALDQAVVFLEFWKEQKNLLDALTGNNLAHFLQAEMVHFVLIEDPSVLNQLSTPDWPSDTDVLTCYISSITTLLLLWHSRDFDTPSEEMASKLLRIIHVPMILPEAK